MIVRLESAGLSEDAEELIRLDVPKRLAFTFSQRWSRNQWSKFWTESLSVNNTADHLSVMAADLFKMTLSITGDLQTGDVIEFYRAEQGDVFMKLNSKDHLRLSSPGFFEFLLTGLIGNAPRSDDLKHSLLGSHTRDKETDSSATLTSLSGVSDRIIEREINESSREGPIAFESEVEQLATDVVEEESPDQSALYVEQLIALQAYQKDAIAKVNAEINYPRRALARKLEGSVLVRLVLNVEGGLESAEIVESSNHKLLDQALLRAVEQAEPFASLPPSFNDTSLEFSAPFAFRLN